MKNLRTDLESVDKTSRFMARALTIVEMLITMGVFSLVVMALLYLHIFGLRQDQLVESKLGASDQARKGFEWLARDIRGAQTWNVGNYSGGAFTPIGDSQLQSGNAVQLFLIAGNSTNIIYYFDTGTPGNWTLNRVHTGDAGPTLIASDLTNYAGGPLRFVAEDYRGTPIYDLSDRRVLHFTLGFLQYQYPQTKIGSNYLYDSYKIDFRFTPHVPPGR